MFDLTDLEIATHSTITMLWQAGELYDENGEPTGSTWEDNYFPEDATPDATARMVDDVREFVSRVHSEDLAEYLSNYGEATLVHDYWLTRNGHGAGFWDRGLGPVGDRLTELSNDGAYELYQVSEMFWSWD